VNHIFADVYIEIHNCLCYTIFIYASNANILTSNRLLTCATSMTAVFCCFYIRHNVAHFCWKRGRMSKVVLRSACLIIIVLHRKSPMWIFCAVLVGRHAASYCFFATFRSSVWFTYSMCLIKFLHYWVIREVTVTWRHSVCKCYLRHYVGIYYVAAV